MSSYMSLICPLICGLKGRRGRGRRLKTRNSANSVPSYFCDINAGHRGLFRILRIRACGVEGCVPDAGACLFFCTLIHVHLFASCFKFHSYSSIVVHRSQIHSFQISFIHFKFHSYAFRISFICPFIHFKFHSYAYSFISNFIHMPLLLFIGP
jgi:hypothetical protein